jgi:hypothetical protein
VTGDSDPQNSATATAVDMTVAKMRVSGAARADQILRLARDGRPTPVRPALIMRCRARRFIKAARISKHVATTDLAGSQNEPLSSCCCNVGFSVPLLNPAIKTEELVRRTAQY